VFHDIKDEHLDIITSLILLCWRCYHPYVCQLQADSVLQSMPFLLY